MLHARQSRRHAAGNAASVLVCLALIATACGDDSTDEANDSAAPSIAESTAAPITTDAPGTTVAPVVTDTAATPSSTEALPSTSAAPTTTPAATAANATAPCDPYYQINAALGGTGDPSTVPALLDELEPVVPAQVDQPLNFMITTAREVIGGGGQDTSAFETPEFAEAVSAVDAWMFDNCDFDSRVDVLAIDFAYEGVDAEYPAGSTAFRVTNGGVEAHELVLVRRNDGVTEPWDDLLALPEAEALTKVTPIGSAFVGQPDSQGTLVADLASGDYIAVCFIPAGTTVGVDGDRNEGSGLAHFLLGMQVEFTVS